jgi:hypothetical protein
MGHQKISGNIRNIEDNGKDKQDKHPATCYMLSLLHLGMCVATFLTRDILRIPKRKGPKHVQDTTKFSNILGALKLNTYYVARNWLNW